MEEVVVKLNNFEGPFDLLLNLIEKNKMKISDINISQLIDEYLEVLKVSKRENIEIKSDFIIIASELIEIKTLNLLNLDKDKEKETNLRRRLEEHKLFKEVVPKIAELEKEFNISYSRGESKRVIKKIAKDYDLTSLTTPYKTFEFLSPTCRKAPYIPEGGYNLLSIFIFVVGNPSSLAIFFPCITSPIIIIG